MKQKLLLVNKLHSDAQKNQMQVFCSLVIDNLNLIPMHILARDILFNKAMKKRQEITVKI